jgi:hypothetical protein
MTPTASNDPTLFADVQDFDVARQQLARRRKLAEQLLATRIEPTATLQGGRAMFGAGPGGTVSQAIDQFSGRLQQPQLDAEEQTLASQEAQQANQILSSIPSAGSPDRQQALLNAGNKFPSLRNSISALLAADERSALRESDNIARREDLAIRLGAEAEMKREHDKAAIELRKTPIVQEYRGGAGGGKKDNPNADLDRQIKQARLDNLKNPKPVASERKAALAQDDLIGRVENAEKELNKTPDAVGLRTLTPNIALQRFDPEGVSARAALAELSAEKAHDLYGASFTAAERKRADQFIIAAGDDLATVRKKLAGMKKMAIEARNRAMGQKSPAAPQQPTPAKPTTPAGTKGMHKGKPVVMGQDGEWRYE